MANYDKINNRRKVEWHIRSDIELKKVLDDIRYERYKRRLDQVKPIDYNELLKASFRFKPLLDVLKEADIKRSKNVKK